MNVMTGLPSLGGGNNNYEINSDLKYVHSAKPLPYKQWNTINEGVDVAKNMINARLEKLKLQKQYQINVKPQNKNDRSAHSLIRRKARLLFISAL